MSAVNNNLLLTADAAASSYQINRSLRFNTPDSAYANRTFGTPTTQGTFTLAMWVKRAALGTAQSLFGVSTNHSFGFTTGNALNLTFGGTSALTTTAVFRDTSAWYHIVWTQSDTSHTVYVNGTSLGTATATSSVFNTAVAHQVGASNTTNYFNGYLADVHFIDGQALTPSSFTETNATTGQLVPKAFGGSYGVNGFRLNFSDNSAATAATLGADSSGNGNNWTPNNLSVSTGGPSPIATSTGGLPIYNTTDTYGAVKGTGTRTDSNAANLVLAIPMDGANNGTTFTDESATIKGSGTAKAITRNGNTKTLTAQSKFYGSSGFFDGNGDTLSLASSTDFEFGTGDFTIEAWVNVSSFGNSFAIYNHWGGAGLTSRFSLNFNSAGPVIDSSFGLSLSFSGSSSAVTGTWYHVACVRNGSTFTLYQNGISVYTATSSATYTPTGYPVNIGDYIDNFTTGSGYLQDLRIYKGVAKYTSNFTPPSATQNTTVAAGNDSLTDTPTSYGTDTGAGGEVRGNYATLNPLDINPTGLTNGNLDAASANAYPTIIPGSGQWYYEVNGTGYTWNGTKANWTLRSGSYNFGQRPFATAATPGYKALCDTNLPTPTIAKGSSVFDTVLYTGTGTALTPTSSLAFSPDLVWIKGRSAATNNAFYDTVRGTTLDLTSTNSTAAETTQTQGLTSFDSNGFTVGTLAKLNTNAATYVGWCWDAGSSTVANTAGSISSQVRANVSAGCSVVTYTGTGVNATVGHGLGVAPEMIIVKRRDSTGAWQVRHTAIAVANSAQLNSTAAPGSAPTVWNSTAPTSSVFSIGTSTDVNASAGTYAAYCFASVTGYSSFGGYGGSSSNLTFLDFGFKPAFFLCKRTNLGNNWVMFDAKRVGYNVDNNSVYSNASNVEATTDLLDFTCTGVKFRSNDASVNTFASYLYAAFAENPFKYARAR